MNELPMNIQRAVRRYEKVEIYGLVFWPVLVKEYTEWLAARPALEVLHQSLPVALMRIPLLSALYKMDFEAAISGKTPSGLFGRTLLALALSLRLGEGMEPEKRIGLFRLAVERGKPENLTRLYFTDTSGEEREITSAQYQTVRQIIAAQNGVRLESDRANPEIVKAQKDMASGGAKLDANVYDLVSAVAALSGADEAQIYEWPIIKLEARAQSWRRILDYLVCGFGEVNGTTWKTGNPTPHPFFARVNDGSGVLRPMDGGSGRPMPGIVRESLQNTQNLLP